MSVKVANLVKSLPSILLVCMGMKHGTWEFTYNLSPFLTHEWEYRVEMLSPVPFSRLYVTDTFL